MRKRYISVIMLAIIMFSFVNEAFAVSEVYMLAPGILKAFDYSDIYDFNKFNEMYKQGYTSFISNKDITFYRHIYWADVFPDKSDSPKSVKFNNDSARNFNIMFYGDDRTVNPNPKDSLGNYNYMGYTKDNRNVTNIVYREDPLPKGTKVMPKPTEYVKKHGYKNARVKPFITNYNKPRHVGELYLGKDSNVDEREKYGQEILKEWAKKVRNRDAWSSNDPRSDYTGKYKYLVDIPDFGGDTNKLLNSMTITVPPTSRSNGQAVAWFIKPDGTHTYRTFYIEKTDPVNFKALDYTWDEETKNLNIRFEIEGLEKVEGIITSYFEQERHQDKNGNFYTYKTKNLVDYFKEEYIAGWEIPYLWFYNTENIEYNTPYDEDLNISMLELEIDLEDPDFDMDYEYIEEDLWRFIRFKTIHVKPELENGKRKTIYDVDYDFSYLKDYRKEDIDLDFFINVYYGDLYEGIDPDDDFYPYMGFPEYHEGALDDNYMKVTIPATRLDFDLKHEDGEESRVFKIKDGVDAKIPVVAKLYNLEIEEDIESVVTNINFYDEKGNWIDTSDDLEFHKDDLEDGVVIQDIIIELKKEDLKPGKNVFYAVINSDFDLTEATPVEKERFLENNKIEIIINVGNVDFAIYPDKALIRHELLDSSDLYLGSKANLLYSTFFYSLIFKFELPKYNLIHT